ncbi:GMP synthase-Glutamine amidotransferase [Andreprevotia lacus DSM 23236]|uniref:GMP synthase-Glutamine amidotransferase n=1 Tax=Andreprevotia lacus DSM 23236 TaxID=1121001 RepID=A0A1W1XYU4_9NEIS|nr:type 1 glutamine amidotransferase [Andreprevotia lacus]SMC29086.1 GMP synthase-Glutamine amidotransferase [Andreprevotia lacus DSM 23236]
MKPIAICQHHPAQGPGYLLDFLNQRALPWRLFRLEDGTPTGMQDYSGVVILGSPASVNDGASWIRREALLVQDALERNKPVLGHCFGGQLLAHVLGAPVRRNPVPQIGWGKVQVTQHADAKRWFGPLRELALFHWHFDTFGIPRRATRVLFGHYCLNKGFAYGPHLGLQSHLEVTAESIRDWCALDGHELLDHAGPSVQTEAQIMHRLDERLALLHQLADRVYTRWIQALSPALAATRPQGGPGWGMALSG